MDQNRRRDHKNKQLARHSKLSQVKHDTVQAELELAEKPQSVPPPSLPHPGSSASALTADESCLLTIRPSSDRFVVSPNTPDAYARVSITIPDPGSSLIDQRRPHGSAPHAQLAVAHQGARWCGGVFQVRGAGTTRLHTNRRMSDQT